MDMLRLYYAALAVCGSVFAGMGLTTVLAGGLALVPILQSLSGVGMVIGVAYEVFVSPPETKSTPDDRLVWIMVAFAMIGGIGIIWSFLA